MEADNYTITIFTNFKKMSSFFYVEIQLQKNHWSLTWQNKEVNVLLLCILICPEPYSFFFLLQTSSNLPILICFTNILHVAAFSSCRMWMPAYLIAGFYLFNRRLHSCVTASTTLMKDKIPCEIMVLEALCTRAF